MTPPLPPAWEPILGPELGKPYFLKLQSYLNEERSRYTVFPPEPEVFTALQLTPFERVSVLILGQDPYHDDNQAHGLAFSVRPGIQPPPCLQNIFKEMQADIAAPYPKDGYLAPWAEQGVLLLNTVLTVRAHQPGSHRNKGWEEFTDQVIRAVGQKTDRVVFLLWGAFAQKKLPLIDGVRHVIIQSAHPSPLSARRGFFGSRPFSRTNAALREAGKPEIYWALPGE